ncbi:MAG: PKD domain-containing protein [Anaerolineales bacterium]|nr:PKD domain-containing protein [Anaerolineales bacterium]
MPPAARAARRRLAAGLLLLAPLTLWLLLAPTPVARGKQAASPLAGANTPEQQRAQDLALADPRVMAALAGHRAEVFGVRAMGGQFPAEAAACAAADCRQVEIYLFDTNTAVLGLVDLDTEQVRAVLVQPGVQPGFNQRVADRAAEIARNSPELIAEAGYVPDRAALTPMSGGRCEPAHLCVAMTLPAANSLIWAVVDMTTETLAGVVRTSTPNNDSELGAAAAVEAEAAGVCPAGGTVEQYGWHVEYLTTASDGFAVANVSHYGVAVLTSAKLAEWHVDYGLTGFNDSTGCGGGGGGYTIYPYGGTAVLPVTSTAGAPGFEVVQDFRMGNWGAYCNYRYGQHYQFFADGSFRAVAAAYGKGCSTDSTYRPLLRLDFGIAGAGGDSVQEWDGWTWQPLETESARSQLEPYDSAGARWRVSDEAGPAYYIVPGQGQFEDGGRGDNAYLYAVAHHSSEGDTDLGSIGTCCQDDSQQGPDAYITGEALAAQDVVVWYVPQPQTEATASAPYCWTVAGGANPETYPCRTGPLFVPTLAPAFASNSPVLSGNPILFSSAPLTGAGPISYTWDFGDGVGVGAGLTPEYVYASDGLYTVTLTVSDAWRVGSVAHTVFVGQPPQAAFTTQTTTPASHAFTFTTASTGTSPMAYVWEFGDGITSTWPSPQHNYWRHGPLTVRLTVSNPLGSDTAEAVVFPIAPNGIWLPLMIRP